LSDALLRAKAGSADTRPLWMRCDRQIALQFPAMNTGLPVPLW